MPDGKEKENKKRGNQLLLCSSTNSNSIHAAARPTAMYDVLAQRVRDSPSCLGRQRMTKSVRYSASNREFPALAPRFCVVTWFARCNWLSPSACSDLFCLSFYRDSTLSLLSSCFISFSHYYRFLPASTKSTRKNTSIEKQAQQGRRRWPRVVVCSSREFLAAPLNQPLGTRGAGDVSEIPPPSERSHSPKQAS